jgi:hypothetical protein
MVGECNRCGGTGVIEYYHDAGDHFSAGPAPNSGMRERPCPYCNNNEDDNAKSDGIERWELGVKRIAALEDANEKMKHCLGFIANQHDKAGNWAVECAKNCLKEVDGGA